MTQQPEPPRKHTKPKPSAFLSNQPEEMVCKCLKPDPKSRFFQQPDEMADHVFSWCDFQSMVSLRATNRRLKGFAEKVLEQRALNDFPAGLPADSETLLHPGWTVADHDALIERGLAQQFGEIDKDRARELLRSRGSVGSSDLLGV